MPYNKENPREQTFIFEDDPIAIAGIQACVENIRLKYPEVTAEDLTAGSWNKYHMVTVNDEGEAIYQIFDNVHRTSGKARAEVYNFFLQLDRQHDDWIVRVEIRKEVVVGAPGEVLVEEQTADFGWMPITRSISVVETITRQL